MRTTWELPRIINVGCNAGEVCQLDQWKASVSKAPKVQLITVKVTQVDGLDI